MSLIPGIEPDVQFILAYCLGAYWIITAVSKVIERIITSRAVAVRSRRDADLAEARYRDERVSGMIGAAVRGSQWDEGERRHRR